MCAMPQVSRTIMTLRAWLSFEPAAAGSARIKKKRIRFIGYFFLYTTSAVLAAAQFYNQLYDRRGQLLMVCPKSQQMVQAPGFSRGGAISGFNFGDHYPALTL